MPLTKYTGANLKKMKKVDLISHIVDLYQFTDLFNNEALYKKQIAKLEEENKKLEDKIKELEGEKLELQLNKDKCLEYIDEYKEENKKLKNIENNDKQEMYAILEDFKEENKFYWESMEKLKKENNKMKDMLLKFKKECHKVKDK